MRRRNNNRRERIPVNKEEIEYSEMQNRKEFLEIIKGGLKSGEIMPVFNNEENKINFIKRDGYYPPELLDKMSSLDGYQNKIIHSIEKEGENDD